MRFKGIIFDFDGTLFDTMGVWEAAGADYLKSVGYTAEMNLNKKLSGMTLLQSAEYLKERYALPMTINEIIDGINKTIEEFYFHSAKPKEKVIEYLSALQSKGIKMCIATATDRYLVEAALKRCDMLGFFEKIFTCSEIGCGKDKPCIYEHACKSLCIEKFETVIFEDAYHAVHTVKDADFFVVGIYDKYEGQTSEIREIADRYYMNFVEILERGELL